MRKLQATMTVNYEMNSLHYNSRSCSSLFSVTGGRGGPKNPKPERYGNGDSSLMF